MAEGAGDGVVFDAGARLDAEGMTIAGDNGKLDYAGATTGRFDNSVVWGGGGLVVATTLNGDCTVGMGVAALTGSGNVAANPLFCPVGGSKPYRLTGASPARDVCPSGLAIDLVGIPRSSGANDDSGSFEYSSCL